MAAADKVAAGAQLYKLCESWSTHTLRHEKAKIRAMISNEIPSDSASQIRPWDRSFLDLVRRLLPTPSIAPGPGDLRHGRLTPPCNAARVDWTCGCAWRWPRTGARAPRQRPRPRPSGSGRFRPRAAGGVRTSPQCHIPRRRARHDAIDAGSGAAAKRVSRGAVDSVWPTSVIWHSWYVHS